MKKRELEHNPDAAAKPKQNPTAMAHAAVRLKRLLLVDVDAAVVVIDGRPLMKRKNE
jgi:hypothetical protein